MVSNSKENWCVVGIEVLTYEMVEKKWKVWMRTMAEISVEA